MKVFHCDHCGQLVFFENTKCVQCERTLAYLPDAGAFGSVEEGNQNGEIGYSTGGGAVQKYRLCDNYSKENVCNWAIREDDPSPLCVSCRLTRVIPDLTRPANKAAWFRLEVAKRRLVYSMLLLDLPHENKVTDPENGLAFEFLADPETPTAESPAVLTGHDNGLITVNIAEADDAEREKRRVQMHEPYRTLLGHFRHEVGHYYWDRLIKDKPALAGYRKLFGDESADYGESLQRYYAGGAPEDWQKRFISAYATSHPWEDWAETWAHYLHMHDTLETALACGLSLKPHHAEEPVLKTRIDPEVKPLTAFETMIRDWFPITYILNNLNRGMGLADGYPFVLSDPVVEKLRFVHDVIHG